MVTVVSTDNAAEADSTATTTTTTTASTATATITQMVTTTILTATLDITGTSLTGNHIKWPIHPIFSNSRQLQETLINEISTQQTRIRKVSQAAIIDTRTTPAVKTCSRAVGFAHLLSSKQYR